MDELLAKRILDAFIDTSFEAGGRHERRVNKMEPGAALASMRIDSVDPEIAQVIRAETIRQQENIELIASENFTSPAVMQAQGSALTNKYAEGYPAKRWYGGCEQVEQAQDAGNTSCEPGRRGPRDGRHSLHDADRPRATSSGRRCPWRRCEFLARRIR